MPCEKHLLSRTEKASFNWSDIFRYSSPLSESSCREFLQKPKPWPLCQNSQDSCPLQDHSLSSMTFYDVGITPLQKATYWNGTRFSIGSCWVYPPLIASLLLWISWVLGRHPPISPALFSWHRERQRRAPHKDSSTSLETSQLHFIRWLSVFGICSF